MYFSYQNSSPSLQPWVGEEAWGEERNAGGEKKLCLRALKNPEVGATSNRSNRVRCQGPPHLEGVPGTCNQWKRLKTEAGAAR